MNLTSSSLFLTLSRSIQFSSVAQSCLTHLTPWTAACQASLSITNSQSLLKLMFFKLVMPSNHLILCHPLLLLPPIFPSIRAFSNESVLHTHPPYPSTSQIFIRFLPSPGPTRQARTLLLPLTIQGGGKGTQASKQNPRSPHMSAVKRMKQGVALKNIHNIKVENCVLFVRIIRTSSLGSSPCPICKKHLIS